VFFGDKKKMLICDLENEDDWDLRIITNPIAEFNYYSSATSLPNG